MDPWVALAVFLLGAAIGALLTAIAYVGRIHELKEQVCRIDQKPEDHDKHLGAA